MKPIAVLFLILAVAVSAIEPSAALADKPSSYLVLKGGLYSPSKSFDLNNATADHFDTRDGFIAEGALGHYFLPFLAVELGGGYFESKAVAPAGESRFKVVPVVATGKLILPFGPVEPYGEFGVGVYIVDLDVSGTFSNFDATTKGSFGYHAGGGINLDLAPNVFLGAEGRYLWVQDTFGATDVKLDGFTVTGNLGFRF